MLCSCYRDAFICTETIPSPTAFVKWLRKHSSVLKAIVNGHHLQQIETQDKVQRVIPARKRRRSTQAEFRWISASRLHWWNEEPEREWAFLNESLFIQLTRLNFNLKGAKITSLRDRPIPLCGGAPRVSVFVCGLLLNYPDSPSSPGGKH